MPSLQSFSTWLTNADPQQLTALLRRRRDLLRTDAPSLERIAGAASTRAAVARGLEALSAGRLQVLQAMAVRARVNPVITLAELPLDVSCETLRTVLDLALSWPAHAQDSARPLDAQAWRIQPEAIALLPTSAAQTAQPPAWLSAQQPPVPEPAPVSAALARNAQAGAASQVVSDLVAMVRTVQAAPGSQLVKGGIGKRDVNIYSSRTGTSPERAVLELELAGRLGLLGVGGSDTDPVWLPTTEFAPFVDAPRADSYGAVLQAWLRLPSEVGQLVDGRDANGAAVHVLADLATPVAPFPGHTSPRPVMPLTRYLLLSELLELGACDGYALDASLLAAALAWHHPLLPSATEPIVMLLLQEAEYLGLVCTPLGASRHFGLTEVGALLARHLRLAMPTDTGPLPFAEQALNVPEQLTATVADLLPPLLHTVIVQSDLTAVATGPLDPRVAAKLDQMADVENRGQGTVYRFTESSVRRALESGLSAAQVLERIEELSGAPPVQPLRFLVHDAADRMHRVRIAAARSVIVVDDPADLAGLAADPIMVAAGLELLSPTVATARVSQDRLAALLDAAGVHTVGGPAPVEHTPAPVRRPAPVAHRSLRVGDADLDAFIAQLLSTRRARKSSGRPAAGANSSPDAVQAALHEAVAAGNIVVLETVGSTGSVNTVRMRPTAVSAGRVRGVRGDATTEVSLPVARIRTVRSEPAGRGDSPCGGAEPGTEANAEGDR